MHTFSRGLLAGIVSLALHLIGRYRDHWWWDNLAHFTAGISIGSAASLIGIEEPKHQAMNATLIATVWELAEFEHGAWPFDQPDVAEDQVAEDTVLDTILVAAGAGFSGWLDLDRGSDQDS